VTPCEVCGVPLDRWESCPSPACPCYGTRADSPEMDAAAERWRSRPSVAAARTLNGAAALELIELRTRLDYLEAAGELIEVEHRWS